MPQQHPQLQPPVVKPGITIVATTDVLKRSHECPFSALVNLLRDEALADGACDAVVGLREIADCSKLLYVSEQKPHTFTEIVHCILAWSEGISGPTICK